MTRSRGQARVHRLSLAIMAGFLLWMVGLSTVYYAVESWRRPIWAVIGFSAAAVVLVGARLHRPRRAWAWLALSAGMATYIVADFLKYGMTPDPNHGQPLTIGAHVGYLAFFVLVAVALTAFAHWSVGSGRASILDALTLIAAVGVVSWTQL